MKPSTVKIEKMPSRFKHQVPKYKVTRSNDCINCGTCAKTCPYGVHERPEGHNRVYPPINYKCTGFECQSKEFCCIAQCPRQALSLSLNPMYETLGDPRWTADMITGTWIMAETGYPPERTDLEYNVGNSGGGFDKLRFKFPANPPKVDKSEISTAIELNRRDDGRASVVISTPVYGGGMSFGSVSLPTMVSKARNAAIWNTFTCTGEGGYPDVLRPYADNVITQVATGLFGVRE
ncbi:MAG: glutamate synthase-related protein, partial [Deltaproteobacteria bacterium]